ncbi:hypothetical protein [Pseudarthrobacter sp. fls2-241-R2A-168]|uniref:hypothetical protein n=1 Tax=Pseudarthrobacter sp. fls2-241-R2A-168 TaxID=3040304 RepID=UPI002553F4B1|nr:hypothetical protein [Pseudarthrobacter sp. fls2-241-R2A-168]
MHDPLIEAIHEHEPLSDPLEEINLRLAIAATDVAELRAEIARLDRDLEESRRLNRRAVELLGFLYNHLEGNGDGGAKLSLSADLARIANLEG